MVVFVRPRRLLLPAVLACAWSLQAGVLAQGRLRPPAFVTCDRNHLTSFSGEVVSLERDGDTTTLRMRTDEDTSERFTVRHPGADAAAWFFIGGRAFAPADWSVVLPGGKPREGARATVWVCTGEANPKVDWVPAEP